jgi:hypothetical protein
MPNLKFAATGTFTVVATETFAFLASLASLADRESAPEIAVSLKCEQAHRQQRFER